MLWAFKAGPTPCLSVVAHQAPSAPGSALSRSAPARRAMRSSDETPEERLALRKMVGGSGPGGGALEPCFPRAAGRKTPNLARMPSEHVMFRTFSSSKWPFHWNAWCFVDFHLTKIAR